MSGTAAENTATAPSHVGADTIGVGPAGYGVSANPTGMSSDGRHVILVVDPQSVSRAIGQALGNAPGSDKIADAIMKQDAKLQVQNKGKAPVVRGRGGLKAQNTAPAPRAVDFFENSTFGKTPKQQLEVKNRIEELLALTHQPMKIDAAYLNHKTVKADEILDHLKHGDAPKGTPPKAGAKTAPQPRQWAGVSGAPSPTSMFA